MIDAFATSLTVRAVGWALLQSLWQGAVIGILTGVALTALRGRSARPRYAVACIGLLAILAVSVVTAVVRARELHTTGVGQAVAMPLAFATSLARGRAAALGPVANGEPSAPPATTVAAGDGWSRERLEAWSVWVVPLWLLGVLVLASRLVASWVIVERVRRAANCPVSELLQARAHVLAARLRLTGPVHIVESAIVNVPMVIGWLRPVILLPGAALTGLSPRQLEAIVAHELAHIRRHDYLINLLQTTTETLLFYHPASWWLSRRIRAEREHCCDDVAVELCGDRVTYAHALVNLEALRRTDVVFAMAATGGPLTRRIRRLLGQTSSHSDHTPTWMVVGVVLAGVSLAALRDGRGQATSVTPPGLSAQGLPTVQTIGGDEGAVRGHVVDVRSGAPLMNATVELSERGSLEAALTDAEGRYDARVRAGEYRVFVRAAGYLPTQYGQRQPSEEGTTIAVRNGQIVDGVDVPLQPAGVLSGKIVDESATARSGVEIELLTERYLPGGPVPVPAGFAQTDASGAFRIDELPPGGYYVRAYGPATLLPRRADGSQVYGSTYYPGATRLDEAQLINIAAGQEVVDVEFALVPVAPRVVTGRLVDIGGPPLDGAKVVMMAHGGNAAFTQTVLVAADGSFQIRHVVPARYMLMVLDQTQPSRWVAATRELTVDADVSGIEIVGRRGAHLDGRVVREGGGPLLFDPRTIRVGLQQRLETRPGIADWVNGFGEGNIVQEDGTFRMDCPGGLSSVQVSDLPSGWTVKAIRLDGADITDQATDFGDGVRRAIEIRLTDRVSGIVGAVTDRNRRVVSNYTVVVFPEDHARWKPPFRLIRHARSRQDGSFQLEALPPADYLAIALDSLPIDAWIDPHVLERLEPLATRFRLDEGAQGTVPLTLSPTPADLLIAH